MLQDIQHYISRYQHRYLDHPGLCFLNFLLHVSYLSWSMFFEYPGQSFLNILVHVFEYPGDFSNYILIFAFKYT